MVQSMIMELRCRSKLTGLFTVLFAVLLVAVPVAGQEAQAPLRVAVVTESAGFVHDVVKPVDGDSTVVKTLRELVVGRLNGEFRHLPKASDLVFDEVDVVVFYTTGAISLDVDGLQRFLENGGGMVGIHCATDTLAKDDTFVALIGGTFDGHPWNANDTVTLRSIDGGHPLAVPIRQERELQEEIYQFKQFDPTTVRTVVKLDPDKTEKKPTRPVPVAWLKQVGEGRMVYTSLGHRQDVWEAPWYADHLVAALQIAAKRVEAETTPNPQWHEQELRRAESKRPHQPWVFRCVLDNRPRTVVAALSEELWAAWDATDGGLFKVWPGGEDGGMNFTGTVYDTRHGPQPQTRGEPLDTFEGSTWSLTVDGRPVEVEPKWQGHTVDGEESVTFHYVLTRAEGEPITIEETPEAAGPRSLRRTFVIQGLPENAVLRCQLANSVVEDADVEGGTWVTEDRGQPVQLLEVTADGTVTATVTW